PASMLFREPDCSGDAYLRFEGSALAARQAVTLSGPLFPGSLPPPGACPLRVQNWLFVTDPFSCPVINFGPGIPPIGLTAFAPGPGAANTLCAPLSIAEPPGVYTVYHRVEDLGAKFTPPFYIP